MRPSAIPSLIRAPAFGAVCLAAAVIPRLLPWLLVLCGLAAGVAVLSRRRDAVRTTAGSMVAAGAAVLIRRRDALPAIPGKAVFAALLVLTAYLFINASWALNAGAAIQKSGEFTLLVVLMAALTTFLSAMDDASAGRAARWAVAGLLLGVFYLVEEFLLGLPIVTFLVSHSQQLAEGMAKEITEGPAGGVASVSPVVLNRNMVAVGVLLVPSLLASEAVDARWRTPVRIALLVLAGLCAWFTDSGTAAAAIAVGLAVLLVGQMSTRTVKWAVVTLWVIGMVFAVPLGSLPSKTGAMGWSFLPYSSAQARFYIWKYTADKTKERPLTGIGVRATRELQPHVPLEEARSAAYRYRPRPGRHAHNAFLQIWLELGAIGAALVLAVGLAVLRAISRLPDREALFGYALFSSICTVASLGYGIWQSWLLSGFAFAVLLYLLGVRLTDARRSGGAPAAAPPASARAMPGT